MKYKYMFIIPTFLASVFWGYSQDPQRVDLTHDHIRNVNEYMSEFRHLKRSESGKVIMEYDDIEGNPYLNEEFKGGRIVMDSGVTFNGPLRFNMYTETIELKAEDGSIYSVFSPRRTRGILIEEKRFKYLPNPDDPSEHIFMEVVGHDHEIPVYIRHKVNFQDAVPPQAYIEASPARFVPEKEKLYILLPDKGYVEIRSKGLLLKALESRKKEIKSFVKSNNLDFSDPEDILKVLDHYVQIS